MVDTYSDEAHMKKLKDINNIDFSHPLIPRNKSKHKYIYIHTHNTYCMHIYIVPVIACIYISDIYIYTHAIYEAQCR